MCFSRSILLLSTFILIAVAASAAPPGQQAIAQDKEYVVDGSFVHDVGALHLNITNWGLIGSQYTLDVPYASAPSARWPGATGVNHLWSAGLWVAGIQLGERLCSTGSYETEIRASMLPEDTMYRLAWDEENAARYPFPMADDDGDGLEDEDPFNGFDDDDDGLIDEDGAGIGNQHFRAQMSDMYAGDFFPDHMPMNIEVTQQTFQWADPEVADFVGFEYTIRNAGVTNIEDLYVGMFSDFDVDDPEGGPDEAGDDQVGFAAATVEAYPGVFVDVAVGYVYEGLDRTTSGYMGFLFLGHPTDPSGLDAPATIGAQGFQRFAGQLPFEEGGDPTNDAERYELMSLGEFDADTIHPDDYRNLLSTGPFASLAVGEELTVAMALVAGEDLDQMLHNAGRARLVYEGMAFDRDGDPANGDEFLVRWLGPEELAVPVENPEIEEGIPSVVWTTLSAAPNPFNPALEVKAALPRDGKLRVSIIDMRGRVIRVLHDGQHAMGEGRWIWNGRDTNGRTMASGVYRVRLETSDRVLQRSVTLVK